jgi:hypothetical protein
MKIILAGLIVLGLSNVVFASEYIHIDKPQSILRDLPQAHNYVDGIHSNGNFRQLAKRDISLMLQEGFREITIDNSVSFDERIQTASDWTVTVFVDHAEKVRTITDKSLNVYKKQRGKEIIQEGRKLLTDKYSFDWEDGYDTDKATLKSYFLNTIKPLIVAASSLQELKDLNNGDEYTWLAL